MTGVFWVSELEPDEIEAGRAYKEARTDPDAGRLTWAEAWEDVAELRGYLADALRALLALWQALNGAEFILGQAVDGLDEVLAQVAVGTENVTRRDVDAALTAMLEAHVRSQAIATIGAGHYEVQIPFGTLTERHGRLVRLEEKLLPLVGRKTEGGEGEPNEIGD